MSRKEPSFGQLAEYMSDIDKSDTQYNVYQNLYARSIEELKSEFMHNARYMSKRQNGNYMYHEILSVTKSTHLDETKQKQMLRDIAYQYAQKRAKHNLVFGTLHDDHEHHLHYHFMISANALGASRRTRLSKSTFSHCKKDMEVFVLTQYPQLEQQVVMGKKAKEKLSHKGSEQKRRTGATPQRDILKERLQTIFEQSQTKQQFFDALNKAQLSFYIRGKTIGVTDQQHNRNYRLKTLGLLEDFHAASERIQLNASGQQSTKNEEQGSHTKKSRAQTAAEKKHQDEMQDIRSQQSSSKNSQQHKP